MSAKAVLRALVLLAMCLQGFLSMGYQMVASRLLAPHFGSSLIVWAVLISTFLAAFSMGSILGGWVSSLSGRRRGLGLAALSFMAVAGLAINAFVGKRLLVTLEDSFESTNLCLVASCGCLFVLPVLSLSAFPPLCAERLSAHGIGAGLSSGLVYGVSTLGNIAGVMATAFLLIPRFAVSTLLVLWLVVATAEVLLLGWLLGQSAAPPSPAPRSPGPPSPVPAQGPT